MRKDKNSHGFTAIRVQGGLFPPEFLQTIAALDAPSQGGTDYGLPRNLSLKDEVARYWRIANDLYEGFVARKNVTAAGQPTSCTKDWLVPLFSTVLGYSDLAPAKDVIVGDRTFPLSHTACGEALPLLFTSPDHGLETADPCFGEGGRRRSPHGLMQELLNAKDTWLWGIVANGNVVRLLRDNPSLTRPAFLEADLELIFQEQLFADFALFWLVFHSSRLTPHDGVWNRSVLEQWRNRSHQEGQRALEHLRDSVTEALKALGNGFLQNPMSGDLRQALKDGTLDATGYFEELLRLVYRLLFLFTAEERGLLHRPDAPDEQKRLYREGYSLGKLRERALKRRHYDRHRDIWQGLRILFGALDKGARPLGLPAMGGLFESQHCEHLDGAEIANESLLEALRSLAYFRSGDVLARVNYRDMGTEELGSVYESLLELSPFLDVDSTPWRFGFVGEGESTRGSQRKLSGSYYTPASLVNELVRSALEPIMEEKLRETGGKGREALLSLRIVDPACGSGHFLLAAARRLAVEIARLESGSDTPDEQARQHAFREVVQHCIHGVDRNPLAVELCRTALWIESVEPGKPLTFLEPHIQCGDSLVGILDPKIMSEGIPDDAYKALTGDSKSVCSTLKKKNAQERKMRMTSLFVDQDLGASTLRVASGGVQLSDLPEESIEQIEVKRKRWQDLLSDPSRRKEEMTANLFVGAFFAVKSEETFAGVPTSEDLFAATGGRDVRQAVRATISRLAAEHRFLHWHLAFKDVMDRGGFDVALGNPPWERIKLQEQEFFASRSQWIAEAPNASERGRRIKELKNEGASKGDTALYEAFQKALHEAEAASLFIHKGGRFPLTGVGDINTYAAFAETFLNLTSQKGRSGFVVPTGIATDNSTKAFFEAITSGRHLASLYDFENREKIFPAVDSRMKFCLLTLGHDIEEPRFVFFATNEEQITDERRRFTLTAEDVERINPNTKTAPVFRSNADAELTKKLYSRVPVLIDENKGAEGNPWGISFMTMFHMANDSGLFRTWNEFEEQGARKDGVNWVDPEGNVWVPLYEAKMVHHYDHRWATFETDGTTSRDVTEREKKDPLYEPLPRYWVPEHEVESRLKNKEWKNRWLLGWRNVTNATNERTVIAGVIPILGVGHSMPLFFSCCKLDTAVMLFVNFSSMVLDYNARQKLGGTNLTYNYLKQFPFLYPTDYCEQDRKFIMPRALELTYTSETMRPFAEDLGYKGPPFRWDPDRRAHLKAELDAYYARLYGLTRDELRYILDPADVKGEDYPSETFRLLKNHEIRKFGEYRTARLVLQAWDRQIRS